MWSCGLTGRTLLDLVEFGKARLRFRCVGGVEHSRCKRFYLMGRHNRQMRGKVRKEGKTARTDEGTREVGGGLHEQGEEHRAMDEVKERRTEQKAQNQIG